MIDIIVESVLLGVGLAMDAFSVSLANGLHDPGMNGGHRLKIAGTFAWFQFMMPMIGWVCVHTVVEAFTALQPLIPWAAFALLVWLGGRMLLEGIREDREQCPQGADPVQNRQVSGRELLLQGVATSIDALSVGFAIASYSAGRAFGAAVIIAVVTLLICLAGLSIGRKFGMQFAGRATIAGGLILIGIGIKIALF